MSKETKATDVDVTTAQSDEIAKILGITDGGDHGFILIHVNDDEDCVYVTKNVSRRQRVRVLMEITRACQKDILSLL